MATTLKDLLCTVLTDVMRAQHESNMRVRRLYDQYGNDGRLAGIKPPSAAIGNLTLTLNYAVTDGIVEEEEKGVNEKGVDRTLRYVCNEVSELLIKTMVHAIKNSHANYATRFAFVDMLPENRDFLKHVRRRFYALLSADTESLIDATGKMKEDLLVGILMPAAVEYLIDHEDIRDLFRQDDAEGLREHICDEFERVLKKELDDILRESAVSSFRRIQKYGSLNIVVGDNQLSQLPPESIQKLTITVNPATQDIQANDGKTNY